MNKEKCKYLICIEWILPGVVREFTTKPMTEEDFEADVRGCVREGLFPIVVEGNRNEVAGIWDNLILTKAMFESPDVFITMGVKYV